MAGEMKLKKWKMKNARSYSLLVEMRKSENENGREVVLCVVGVTKI